MRDTMLGESKPSWLTIQEHGVLAEARTRAFLLERFWVLDRSVDIEGADFIIQRRLTNRSILDPSPPRFGFIQAKFYSNASTTQYIHKEYVLDSAGIPRMEFFLMCHTGTEDGKRSFVLSADDIKSHFRETAAEHSRPGRFVLPGRDILVQRFEVLDQARVLNQIDKALHDADFYKNRSFLSWALPRSDSSAPILPMYEETIDNWLGDIPQEFEKVRERARRAQWDLEEVLNKLREIEVSPDPERVLTLAEDLQDDYRGQVSLPDLWDEDFFVATQYHKKRYDQLNQAGLLGAHAALRRVTTRKMIDEIAPKMPMGRDVVYVLRLRYDPATLLLVHLESRFEESLALLPTRPPDTNLSLPEDIPTPRGLLTSAPGEIELYLIPGRYGYDRFEKGKWIATHEPWEEKIAGLVAGAVGELLMAVLDLRFGK
jgi:hypothetical protein